MIDILPRLNWAAVIVAIFACFLLGGIWFPFIVKRQYERALATEMKSGLLALLGPLFCMTVTTISTAVLIHLLGVKTYAGAVACGLFVGIGYQTPMTINIALNPLFPRPFLYSAVNAPYFVIGSVLVSLITFAF